MIEIKKKTCEKGWDKIYNQFGFLDRIFLVLTLWTKQVVLKNMEVENKTIPGPKWRPILLLKSMEAENIFLTLCPLFWGMLLFTHTLTLMVVKLGQGWVPSSL